MTRDCFFLRFFEVRILHNTPSPLSGATRYVEAGRRGNVSRGWQLVRILQTVIISDGGRVVLMQVFTTFALVVFCGMML
jgi:hypothetical protein